MLNITCDSCHQQLTEAGALLFSPPDLPAHDVKKYHLCRACYKKLWPLADK